MVRERLGPELRALGFKRLRNRFARRVDRGWLIVDFQASQFGSRDDVAFTINLAVALDDLPRIGHWDARRPPPEHHAHIRERLNLLVDPAHDHWWRFDDTTDADELSRELMALIRRVGLPWLERRSSLARVLELVTSHPGHLGSFELAFLPKKLRDAGYTDAAESLLRERDRRR